VGYTHYWYRPEEIDPDTFKKIVADFEKLLPYFGPLGVKLGGSNRRKEPEIWRECVRFNGRGEDICQDFVFERIYDPPKWQEPDPRGWFCCCKTGRLPYDLAVTAFLVIAKHHLGDQIHVYTDGELNDWQNAIALCRMVLGYGDYPVSDDDI